MTFFFPRTLFTSSEAIQTLIMDGNRHSTHASVKAVCVCVCVCVCVSSIQWVKNSEFELIRHESSRTSDKFNSIVEWDKFELIRRFRLLQLRVSSGNFWCPGAVELTRLGLVVFCLLLSVCLHVCLLVYICLFVCRSISLSVKCKEHPSVCLKTNPGWMAQFDIQANCFSFVR